jgi:hypothetical protein
MEVERRAGGSAPARYRLRHPSRSLLYRCVQQHLRSRHEEGLLHPECRQA